MKTIKFSRLQNTYSMPGRPPKAPSGFLTKNGVAAWAKARGIYINPRTLSLMAHKGKIPHAQPIPGRKRGRMFPDERKKLEQVVAACPKRTITAEQSFSTHQVLKLAQEKKLPLCLAEIQNRIKIIQAGKLPWPAGLKRDELDPRKRWILPKSFVDSVLAEAKLRKDLTEMLKAGELVPLSLLAKQLGFAEKSLHPRQDIEKIRIGPRLFVSRAEAERLKKEYEAKRKGEIPSISISTKVDYRTKKEIAWWLKNMIPRVRDKKKRSEIISLLENGKNYPYALFRGAIMTKINEILAEKK